MSGEGWRERLNGAGYYLDLLTNKHEYFEEDPPLGMEISDDVNSEFQRWARGSDVAPVAGDAAELDGGYEVVVVEDWKEFDAWIDGKSVAMTDEEIEAERERHGLELGD